MRLTLKLLSVSILLLSFVILPAQDLKSVLDGKIPQRIKPADLGEDMRAVKISYEKQAGGGGDIFSMLMSPMMMMMGSFGQMMGGGEGGSGNTQETAAFSFFDRLSISWTNGTTVKLYEQDFLVTYAAQINMAEAMKQKSPPDLSKVDLVLTLINTKSIAAVTPRLDMTKEEWLKPAPPVTSGGGDGKSSSISNAKQLGTALMIYCADYDDVIPYVQSTKGVFEVMYPYMKNVEITKSLNPAGSKFLLNMAVAGASQASIEAPSDTVLFYEDKPWADGTRIVVFCDSSTKTVTEEEWQKHQATLSLKLQKVGRPLPATLGSNWPPSDR